MSTEDLDALLERMPRIAEAVNAFNSETVQQEAFVSLVAAFNGKTARRLTDALPNIRDIVEEEPVLPNDSSVEPDVAPNTGPQQKRPRKKSNGAKSDWTMVKDLDLFPEGKKSFEDFIVEKQPSSNQDRFPVIIYYLTEILGISPVTKNEVGTVFRLMARNGWQEPTNLTTGLQMAAHRKATIDSSSTDDLKITPTGRNFVLHKLPSKSATK
jgi:hypothetical protein